MSWYLAALKKYAVFTGRACRKEYWMFVLFMYVFYFALVLLDGALGLVDDAGSGLLSTLYQLSMLIPSLAVAVRRMHDTNNSGWMIVVPVAGAILLLAGGTAGPNRFGPDPKTATLGYSTAPVGSPGWYVDPTGRHQFRFWDSWMWTEHVSDGGVSSRDSAYM